MTNETNYHTCGFCGLSFGDHEDSCPMSEENINPNVYQAADGHAFLEARWPSLTDRCVLCGSPETIHLEVNS